MDRVAALRAFNRFWTARIGVLDAHLHETSYSLTEARVIFELAQRRTTPVAELRAQLGLDAGYLSRILARFARGGLATLQADRRDARRHLASLTARGRKAFRELDARSSREVRALLGELAEDDQQRVLAAMQEIRRAFDPRRESGIVLRPPGPGDLGWVVERHGALYAHEYRCNEEFEALVARIVADYAADHDPEREAAWIAEVDGARAGCVFCVKQDARTAKLRLLLVEPSARGLGLGTRLVSECVEFARARRYRRIVLWTNDVLHDARRIYERAGFQLVQSGKHRSFGHDLVEQTWALSLTR